MPLIAYKDNYTPVLHPANPSLIKKLNEIKETKLEHFETNSYKEKVLKKISKGLQRISFYTIDPQGRKSFSEFMDDLLKEAANKTTGEILGELQNLSKQLRCFFGNRNEIPDFSNLQEDCKELSRALTAAIDKEFFDYLSAQKSGFSFVEEKRNSIIYNLRKAARIDLNKQLRDAIRKYLCSFGENTKFSELTLSESFKDCVPDVEDFCKEVQFFLGDVHYKTRHISESTAAFENLQAILNAHEKNLQIIATCPIEELIAMMESAGPPVDAPPPAALISKMDEGMLEVCTLYIEEINKIRLDEIKSCKSQADVARVDSKLTTQLNTIKTACKDVFGSIPETLDIALNKKENDIKESIRQRNIAIREAAPQEAKQKIQAAPQSEKKEIKERPDTTLECKLRALSLKASVQGKVEEIVKHCLTMVHGINNTTFTVSKGGGIRSSYYRDYDQEQKKTPIPHGMATILFKISEIVKHVEENNEKYCEGIYKEILDITNIKKVKTSENIMGIFFLPKKEERPEETRQLYNDFSKLILSKSIF